MKLINLGKATAETKNVIQPGPVFDNLYGATKRQ
jgi:hypothetical protein